MAGRTSISHTKQDGVQVAFLNAVRAAGCLQPGDPVVLGVSGGADSLTMLRLFVQAQPALGVRPHVLHVNHHIRGAEAGADAAFVAETCRVWGVPCRVAEADVPALARQNGLTIEDAARRARYRALAEEAKRVGARVIAAAHNADDQAETVLMHFLRGSGMAGLRGMRPVTPLSELGFLESPGDLVLLRPLLDIPRAEIDAFCAANGLTPRLDHTNLDTTYTRNRLRHEVIPLLEKVAPGLRARLAHSASVIDADAEQLERDLDEAWARVAATPEDGLVMIRLADWRSLSRSLQRATIRRAIAHLNGGLLDVGYVHVEDALRVAHSGSVGAQASLPRGVTLRVGYHELIFAGGGHGQPIPAWPLITPDMEIGLAAPGQIDLPSGWRLAVTRYEGPRSGPGWAALLADPWSAVLDLPEDARCDLRLRPRREGDHFRPQGVGGTQKVREFMINAKIPAAWRDRIPLLVAGGQIAWLCGWRVDERFLVTPETKEVWLARFERAAE